MRKKRGKKKFIVFILLFFVFIFLYYLYIILPVAKTYTIAKTRELTEKAINLAVSNVVNRSLSYDALIDVNYNSNGEIATISANQFEINSISREIVKEAQFQMNDLSTKGLKINIGTFSGIPFFIGRGPIINLKIMPIGSVESEFSSEFDAVGINMTRHTLFLYINVHINIVLPIKAYDYYSTNQVMLAESIIIGKVPEVYLHGDSLGKSLNLVP